MAWCARRWHNAFKDQTAPTAFNHVRQRVEKSKAPGEKYDIMFTAVVPTEVGIAQKKVNCSEIDVVLFISHEIRLQIEVLLRDPLWLVHELMHIFVLPRVHHNAQSCYRSPL